MYIKPFFDAYGGPYKDKYRFWTGMLLLIRIVFALVVSIDTKGTVSLDVLMCFLNIITSLHIFLRGIYCHFPLNCLEMSFIFNLIFMAYMNIQTMKLSRRQLYSTVSVSLSFAIFCGITLYHIWERLSKFCLKEPIIKVKKIFKKSPLSDRSDHEEHPLIVPGSLSIICETSSISVVMRRESLLFDEDD